MSEESKLPSEVVKVPQWVADIENALANYHRDAGRLLLDDYIGHYQILHLCQEVRELSAIAADLRESKDELYTIVVEDEDGDIAHGFVQRPAFCLSEARHNAADLLARLAEEANDPDAVLRIYAWKGAECRRVCRMARDGVLCAQCGGVGAQDEPEDETAWECKACNGTGRAQS